MRALVLISLLALAACATPRQQCEADAMAPYRAALQERARLANDLARGYVFETKFETRRTFGWCNTSTGRLYQCWETETQPVTRRVPIDAPKVEARLAALTASLPALRKAATTDIAQCVTLYPEGPAQS